MALPCRMYIMQDINMEYTGTRYSTRLQDGYYQLTGSAGFVSNRVSDQGTGASFFANAGGSAGV